MDMCWWWWAIWFHSKWLGIGGSRSLSSPGWTLSTHSARSTSWWWEHRETERTETDIQWVQRSPLSSWNGEEVNLALPGAAWSRAQDTLCTLCNIWDLSKIKWKIYYRKFKIMCFSSKKPKKQKLGLVFFRVLRSSLCFSQNCTLFHSCAYAHRNISGKQWKLTEGDVSDIASSYVLRLFNSLFMENRHSDCNK